MRNHIGVDALADQNIPSGRNARKYIKTRDKVIRICDTCGKKFTHDGEPFGEKHRNRCPKCKNVFKRKICNSVIEIR